MTTMYVAELRPTQEHCANMRAFMKRTGYGEMPQPREIACHTPEEAHAYVAMYPMYTVASIRKASYDPRFLTSNV